MRLQRPLRVVGGAWSFLVTSVAVQVVWWLVCPHCALRRIVHVAVAGEAFDPRSVVAVHWVWTARGTFMVLCISVQVMFLDVFFEEQHLFFVYLFLRLLRFCIAVLGI